MAAKKLSTFEVKINNSKKEDWYYKFQFKNNKQKTFEVIPNKTFDKFMVIGGEFHGREISPFDIQPVNPFAVLRLLKELFI